MFNEFSIQLCDTWRSVEVSLGSFIGGVLLILWLQFHFRVLLPTEALLRFSAKASVFFFI